MKTIDYLGLALWTVFITCRVVPAGEIIETNGYPSAVSPINHGLSAGDAFVIERSDFRLLFCDADTLRARILGSRCVVDGRPKSGVRGHSVAVQNGTTLREVLRRFGLSDWSGGHPQIRVIKRNEIIQSERPDGITISPFDPKEFLNQTISAGDIIVLTARI